MNPGDKDCIIFLSKETSLICDVDNCLHKIGYDCKTMSVDNLSTYSENIRSGSCIMTIADNSLGGVVLSQAISISKSIDRELPFIIVIDKNDQEDAVKLIDEGASDYITTDNLCRLKPVLKREIKAYNEMIAVRRARQEIRELNNIIDSAEDEIYILDGKDFKIKFANRKATRNLKYKQTELKTMSMNDITQDIVPVAMVNGDGHHAKKTFYTRMMRKDGTSYPAEAVYQTAETEGKRAILCIVQDITEKQTAKQQAVMLNKAIEASASAVIITDASFRIIYTNKAMSKLTGKSRSEILGKNILETMELDKSSAEFEKALKDCASGDSWVGEYARVCSDGEKNTVLGSVSPVLNDAGSVENIIIVEEDISERIKIKSQLMHAQKMETVGELTSGIAHDFTNMLTAIGGFASIMKRKMDPENNFYTYVEKIFELTLRAKSLTQNLLTFSRKQMQAERVLSLNTLVDTVSSFLSMVIGSKLEIQLNLSPEDMNIVGDPVQLEQVIINLATNARDAIQKNGVLVISTDKVMISETGTGFREYAVISVKDNGSGIEESKIKKIFEPFFTTKEEGKGTGLGLYIVSDIIAKHHGFIECKSEPGVGTEFIIKLPVTLEKPETEQDEAEVKTSKNATILLVEDEKMVRESLINALDAYGYKVVEAVNGRDAVDKFYNSKIKIDLVISDIVMPVMDGIEAYEKMCEKDPDLKIIFTTGYVGEAHKRNNFDEKNHIILLKPLLVKELIKRIEQLITK